MTQDLILRPYQERAISQLFDAWKQGARSVIMTVPTGCHAPSEPILMHDGSVRRADSIKVGDALMGPDSTPRIVSDLHEGRDEMYRIVPVKGRPFVVNKGHILTLQKTRERASGSNRKEQYGNPGEIVDVSVEEWLRWTPSKKHVFKLFRTGVDFPHREDFFLSPYFVGILLGDGSMSTTCQITTADSQILDAFTAEAEGLGLSVAEIKGKEGKAARTYSISSRKSRHKHNCVTDGLAALGLRGKVCHNKFIPDEYKLGSRETRLQVLAGLIDTDGSLTRKGYDFISLSYRLSQDVAFIARSLGLAAYVKPCLKSCQTGAVGRYYRVSVSGKVDCIPCRVPRKIAGPRLQLKSVLRTGFKVEPLGKGSYFGFSVNRDHRYLMGDFTVTHNSGKRLMALWLMKYAQERERKTLFVANRRLLVDQAWADAEKYGVSYGVIMANREQGDIGSTNQIASIHTLESWYFYDKETGELDGTKLPNARLVQIDECFTAETKILTVDGPKRIDMVRCGDLVYNATGVGEVNGLFKKTSIDIYTIGFTDGTSVTCTGNHPFFTDRGWVAASLLARGEGTYGPEDLRGLWSGVFPGSQERFHYARNIMERSDCLLNVLLKEAEESDEQQGITGEDESKITGNKTPSDHSPGQRSFTNPPSTGDAPRPWGGMGGRVPSSCGGREGKWLSDVLQNRRGKQQFNDRFGAGREKSFIAVKEATRYQENGGLGQVRVAYISRHERTCPRTVFNISVNGHPSYFANGRLVHNCHQETKRYKKLLELYPDSKFVCFSATPVGSQGRSIVPDPFDHLIEPVKNSELIRDGFLLNTTVFAPSEPNIQGVGIDGGKEYNQSALGRAVREVTLFADIFKEWEAYQDQATVVFVPGIAYGRDIVNQFNHRLGSSFHSGKAAYLIEAKTPQKEREEIIARVTNDRKGVLVSCDILREGFDCAALSVAIDLQPNSQLRTYWQKVGRIKRPYPGQSVATYLDFAGNYWRFPHPNEDPEWPIGGSLTTQDIIDRRRADKTDPQPIACPRCGLVRHSGSVCPGCGHASGDPVRRVRMGDGKLVEIPLESKKKRELTDAQRAYNEWKGCLYGALARGWTYGQCIFIYRKKTGEWPKDGWPGVCGRQSLELKRRPADDYTKAELTRLLIDRSPK